MKQKIASFYKQPNELNEIIRKLHIVIDFVIISGCNEETKIMYYATETLGMKNLEDTTINKQVNIYKIYKYKIYKKSNNFRLMNLK